MDGAAAEKWPWIEVFWELMTFLNAALLLLNLIPLPPLDGFGALEGAFDLGQLGPTLRALQPFPLLAAIVVANTNAFQGFVHGLADSLKGLFAAAFGG
jgi:Zn-dependent protease